MAQQLVFNRVHVLKVVTYHAHASHVENILANTLQGGRKAFASKLLIETLGRLQARCNGMDGTVPQTNLSVFIEVLELGRNLPDGRLVLGHQDLESVQFGSFHKLDIKRLSRLFLDKGRFNYRFVQYNSPSPLIMQGPAVGIPPESSIMQAVILQKRNKALSAGALFE